MIASLMVVSQIQQYHTSGIDSHIVSATVEVMRPVISAEFLPCRYLMVRELRRTHDGRGNIGLSHPFVDYAFVLLRGRSECHLFSLDYFIFPFT